MKMKTLLLTIVATIGLIAATMAQNVPNYVPTNGLVGWWPFNGNANDESGNGNNGTVNGASLAADRFGNSNAAYDFDGVNDFIDLSNTSFQGDFSLSFWFSIDIISTQKIISKFTNDQNNPNGWEIELGNNGSLNYGNGSQQEYGQNIYTNNTWSFGTLVFNSNNSQVTFYENGTQSSIYNNFSLINNNINVRLGARANPVASIFYNGKIDDIGLWNLALTAQEISDLYNGNICYQTITVTDTLLISTGIVGYSPITYSNTIKIFPNPSSDHITIDYGNYISLNGYQLQIENSLGQQLFQTNITQQSDYLSLNNWGGNGLYFVHIIDPQGNTIDIRKIVLQ
jgi:hypothetical protein